MLGPDTLDALCDCLVAARVVTDPAVKLLYVAEARRRVVEIRARLDAEELNLASLEAELVRRAR